MTGNVALATDMAERATALDLIEGYRPGKRRSTARRDN